MRERTIYITEYDMARLKTMIQDTMRSDRRNASYLESLESELARASTVAPEQVPPDAVTMNSRFRLVDLDTGEEMIYTLVFPADADLAEGKLSVLAPIGTAILGYRVGDEFTWRVPAGVSRLQVAEVLYQPEAAGDYHL